MKRKLASIFIGIFFIAGAIYPVSSGAATKEETRLERSATGIDSDAQKPNGEKPIVQKIESEFKVTDEQISSLRSQKLGYGEITIVFALANASGKTTDQIIAMRNGPPKMGWGEIAKKLGVKLGSIISNVERVKKEERHETKERIEKSGKPERPERPERTGR